MDQQDLTSLTSGASAQAQSQSQQQIDTVFNKLQPQLQILTAVGVLLTIVIIIVSIVNALYKWRVERAILRMDKNLKKLLEAQVATPTGAPVENTPPELPSET